MPTKTVNFSVPDEVKRAFYKAFAGENKSAVIARLMQQAVEDRQRQRRRDRRPAGTAVGALIDLASWNESAG